MAEQERLPATRVEAAELLRRKDIVCVTVLGVDHDSIVFISHDGLPMTAWLRLLDGLVHVQLQRGFQATRPALYFDGDE